MLDQLQGPDMEKLCDASLAKAVHCALFREAALLHPALPGPYMALATSSLPELLLLASLGFYLNLFMRW